MEFQCDYPAVCPSHDVNPNILQTLVLLSLGSNQLCSGFLVCKYQLVRPSCILPDPVYHPIQTSSPLFHYPLTYLCKYLLTTSCQKNFSSMTSYQVGLALECY